MYTETGIRIFFKLNIPWFGNNVAKQSLLQLKNLCENIWKPNLTILTNKALKIMNFYVNKYNTYLLQLYNL